MSSEIWFSSNCGRIEIEFRDMEQVYSMYHCGDCEESVKAELPYFLEVLESIPEETKIQVLEETGGWTAEELESLTSEEINIKLLWIAAGDIHDTEEMDELCKWQNDFLSDIYRASEE